MDSKGKYYSMVTADKGTDDVGLAQPSGPISGYTAAASRTGRSDWNGKLAILVEGTGAAQLKDGQPIRIANTDSEHTGLTRVLKVLPTSVIVNKDFSSGATAPTGMWFVDGGANAWDAFAPLSADLTGANVAMTFWDTNKQGGSPTAVNYEQGKIYVFPGVIKTIQISTAGDIRLIRSATTRPWGKDAQ